MASLRSDALRNPSTSPSCHSSFQLLSIPHVSSAPASLALKTDALITFGFCSADDDGHYHIKLPNHIREFNRTGNTKADTLALTQEISRLTEEQIRRDPSPWMWSYKRWSHIQPGSDPGRYPSYALPMLSKEL